MTPRRVPGYLEKHQLMSQARPIYDTDIHQSFPPNTMRRYLPAYFRQSHFRFPTAMTPSPLGVSRADAVPENGPAGSDYDLLCAQHLDAFGITYALLTGNALAVGIHPDIDFGNAFASAYNDAVQEIWLPKDKRFFASLVINANDPRHAVGEIRKRGGDPRIAEVLFCSASVKPLGDRSYWPIYEAACEMGLPVSVHPGTEGRGISNGFIAGAPTTYLEWHTNLPQNYMGQIVSLVCQGVFEQFPDMIFVAKEGGLGWIPGVLWRLDKNWKGLRSSVPWIRRLPSEVILDHVRFTSQPVEEPEKNAHFFALMEMIHAEKTLMFSSDYPHWDNDSPTHGLPRLPDELADRVYYQTADEVYRFSEKAKRFS